MTKMLINGVLREKPTQPDGHFQRLPSQFRRWIEADPGAPFPAEPGRYHLYLSKACPWCHGVDLVRRLCKLDEVVSVTWMAATSAEQGWVIDQTMFDDASGVPRDLYLYQVYQRAAPDYTGAISVPVLIDKKSGEIVSTDSADMMRNLVQIFADPNGPDLYPVALAGEIDQLAELIQAPLRNGVYRAGFATSQAAYDEAVEGIFATLDKLEERLATRRYLTGPRLTEIDLKLFPTLLRFDPVYVTHFKIDQHRLSDYPALSRYVADMAQLPDVRSTIDLPHIRAHYFLSHRHLNPHGIIPKGPATRQATMGEQTGAA